MDPHTEPEKVSRETIYVGARRAQIPSEKVCGSTGKYEGYIFIHSSPLGVRAGSSPPAISAH